MKYAQVDTDGNIIAFYDDAIHNLKFCEQGIKISEEQWQACLAEPGKYKIQDGKIILDPEFSHLKLKFSVVDLLTRSYERALICYGVSYDGNEFNYLGFNPYVITLSLLSDEELNIKLLKAKNTHNIIYQFPNKKDLIYVYSQVAKTQIACNNYHDEILEQIQTATYQELQAMLNTGFEDGFLRYAQEAMEGQNPEILEMDG